MTPIKGAFAAWLEINPRPDPQKLAAEFGGLHNARRPAAGIENEEANL
jgi:hypothetical protein